MVNDDQSRIDGKPVNFAELRQCPGRSLTDVSARLKSLARHEPGKQTVSTKIGDLSWHSNSLKRTSIRKSSATTSRCWLISGLLREALVENWVQLSISCPPPTKAKPRSPRLTSIRICRSRPNMGSPCCRHSSSSRMAKLSKPRWDSSPRPNCRK